VEARKNGTTKTKNSDLDDSPAIMGWKGADSYFLAVELAAGRKENPRA
jgi:hypothetical protein